MTRVDHLIVGGGVVGCALAWELARRGRDVVVLEAATVAAGASGGPGERGVRANGRDPRELAVMRRAHELWPGLAGAIGGDTGFRRTGHLDLTERDADWPTLEARVARQRAFGVDSESVGRARLDELEPDLSNRVVAAVHCPVDGVADHTTTTVSLARAARRAGADVREGVAVDALRRSGEGLAARTADGEIEADAVVVAANAGTAALLASIAVDLALFRVFPQALVTPPLEHVPVRHLIGHLDRPVVLKALPDRSVMVTGGRLGRLTAAGRGEPDPDQVRANLADAAALYPSLANAEPVVAVADRAEAVSRDLVAIVDRVPGADRAWFACGWSGHGWALAPAVGELLAGWIVDGVRPEALEPLRLDR